MAKFPPNENLIYYDMVYEATFIEYKTKNVILFYLLLVAEDAKHILPFPLSALHHSESDAMPSWLMLNINEGCHVANK